MLEWLSELRDSSLVGVVDTAGGLRFSMLETIHEYAAEQPEQSAELEAVFQRHADYFVSLAEATAPALLGPEGVAACRLIGREQENFRATLRWADARQEESTCARPGVALVRHCIRLASWEQEARWLTGLRGERGSGDDTPEVMSEPLANLMFPLGGLTGDLGDPVEATRQLAEVVQLFLRQGETVHAAWVLLWMAYLVFERSLTESRRYVEEALSLMRRDGTAVGVGSALTPLACLCSYQGEHEQALEAITEALGLLRDRAAPIVLGNALLVAGRAALLAGNLAAARTRFERNMALRQQIGDLPGVGVAHHHFGMLAISEGDFGAAERCLTEVLALYDEARWDASYWAAWAVCHLGRARMGLGQERQAASASREALVRFRRRKSLFGARLCLHLLAEVAPRRQMRRAARLLGACETMRLRLGAVSHGHEQEQLVKLRARLVAEMGEVEFAAEEAFGASLEEDGVYALALEELAPVD